MNLGLHVNHGKKKNHIRLVSHNNLNTDVRGVGKEHMNLEPTLLTEIERQVGDQYEDKREKDSQRETQLNTSL